MEANQEARSTNVETRGSWRSALVSDLLDDAAVARRHLLETRDIYRDALHTAHGNGATVSELASALGISRTAVYKQLGRKEGQ